MMIGLLYLAILTLVYVLISVALGAIIAAIVAAARSLKEMDSKPNKQVQSIAGNLGSD